LQGAILWVAPLKPAATQGDTMLTTFTSLLRDQEGATMVEYGLLIGFIALVVIGAVKILGTNLSTIFNTVAGTV
jgi:pilus assembly protein Flp/PilA